MELKNIKILVDLAFSMGYDAGMNNAGSMRNALSAKKAALKEFHTECQEYIPEFNFEI